MQQLQGTISLQDNYTPALHQMADALEEVLKTTQMVGAETGKAFSGTQIGKARIAMDKVNASLMSMKAPATEALPKPIEEATKRADLLIGKLKQFVSIVAVIKGISLFKDTADEINNIYARMNLMNDGLQTTDELMEKVYKSAQRSRGAFKDTADFVAKLGGSTEGVFASNDELITFAETLNKQFALSGTTQAEQASAMLQLTQAMGSGVLRGEEFNAVLEASPGVIKLIANEMGVTVGEMRNLAAEGEITSDVVKSALLNASDDVAQKFESMPMTFDQFATSARNRITMAFIPLFNMFEKGINSDAFQSAFNNMIGVVEKLVSILQILGAVAGAVASFIYDNWSFFEPLIVIIGSALIAYLIATKAHLIEVGIQGMIAGLKTVAGFIAANAPVLALGAVIGIVIYALIKMGVTVQEVVGFIVGIIWALVQTIFNAVKMVGNFILGIIERIINAFLEFGDLVSYVFSDIEGVGRRAFNALLQIGVNIINRLIGGFESLVNGAIGGLNSIINLANKIPGINIGTIGQVQLGRVQWDLAEVDSNFKRSERVAFDRFEYANIGDAFDTGFQFGHDLSDSVIGKVQSVLDSAGAKIDSFGNVGGLGDLSNLGDIADHTGDTAKNTKTAAEEAAKQTEELKRTNTDLRYMRDLAVQRSIISVTWDKLDVNVSNSFGDIHETADLDGWIGGLNDALTEAIEGTVGGGSIIYGESV